MANVWVGDNYFVTEIYAKDALKWAARTYLVGAIGSLGTLLYYISMAMRNQRNR